MKRGDKITIEHAGRIVLGMVLLASSNGKSLMLGFDGIIEGHVGSMPVLRDDDGSYRSIMSGCNVKVKKCATNTK
jgi:hypothetical protein